ncbi:hypothetical protein HMPREF9296_1774 [Prevotella disiens FB035-09AN]|uniref:Uncharacterized protein n=1 Tax=Prevotella disiens FB035-09AN TaxID=866771 RepID=E1KSW3_9BACT|nr:hypothetical protein HMPREF9296_1774 [Prevotella disiens FB035-09AN]
MMQEINPEMKNSIPAVMVIQVMVSSLYFMSSIPIAMAIIARMIEL